jgi:alginate O-acetyltransferase complex protein AlgJ
MKNEKRISKYFIVISLLIIGIIPAINLYQDGYKDDFKKIFNTDIIESYVNYTVYKVFNKSLEQDRVITGKDGFLFLGNHNNNILHKRNGIFKSEKQVINTWADKLKDVQIWYENRGIRFAIVIAPNKHSVYKNKLPYWMNYKGQTFTDDLVEYARNKKINILDLRKTLINNKDKYNHLLYLKTDTHWNGLGASIGYNETIKFLNKTYEESYKSVEYNLSYHKDRGKDLSNLLKISNILPKNHEESIWFKFKNDYDICVGNIEEKSLKLQECTIKNNPITETGQYTINKKPINNVNALILSDSFARLNSQLYNTTFNNVWKLHWLKIFGSRLSDFVTKYKPDIVIYQIVERDLDQYKIVKKL